MKVYRQNDQGVMFTADAPDGAMCIQIEVNPPPIIAIDFDNSRFRRAGESAWRPFPEKWYRPDDLTWTPIEGATR